jgi:hypothetical protein
MSRLRPARSLAGGITNYFLTDRPALGLKD